MGALGARMRAALPRARDRVQATEPRTDTDDKVCTSHLYYFFTSDSAQVTNYAVMSKLFFEPKHMSFTAKAEKKKYT